MKPIQELAKEVYTRRMNINKQVGGMPSMAWDELPTDVQERWTAEIELIRISFGERVMPILDNREKAQIAHALDYAEKYQPAGIPGHGQLILIAKLARALGLS